jgi:hypothetical protein
MNAVRKHDRQRQVMHLLALRHVLAKAAHHSEWWADNRWMAA